MAKSKKFPDLKDYARLQPPYVSVIMERKRPVRWHDTERGARRSAFYYQNVKHSYYGDADYPKRWAEKTIAIGRLTASGDIEIIESYLPGDEIKHDYVAPILGGQP